MPTRVPTLQRTPGTRLEKDGLEEELEAETEVISDILLSIEIGIVCENNRVEMNSMD